MHATTIGKLWTYDFPRKPVPAGTVGRIVRYETRAETKCVYVRTEYGLIICARTRVEISR